MAIRRGAAAGSLTVFLAVTAPARALELDDFDLSTTQDLVDLCSVDPDDPLRPEAQQACYAYIAGTIHFYRSLVDGGDRFEPIICPGRELTRQEVAALLVDWAKSNPGRMDELPVEGVVRAAVAAHPCPPTTSPAEDQP